MAARPFFRRRKSCPFSGKNARGATAMVKVRLRPQITWVGAAPSAEQLDKLHHRSHEACFIANSVTTEVTVQH